MLCEHGETVWSLQWLSRVYVLFSHTCQSTQWPFPEEKSLTSSKNNTEFLIPVTDR